MKNIKASLIAKSKERKLIQPHKDRNKPRPVNSIRRGVPVQPVAIAEAPVLVIQDKVTVQVVQGDITEERTDAIVNTTNDQLNMGK